MKLPKMYIINYLLNIPFWVMVKEFCFIKTKIILYKGNKDTYEKFISSVSIFNIIVLIYEVIIHYIYALGKNNNYYIFFICLIRNCFIILFFNFYNNPKNLLKLINISIYVGIFFYTIQYIVLSQYEYDDDSKKGYLFFMIVLNNFYFISNHFIIFKYYNIFDFVYESNDIIEEFIEDICCICLESVNDKMNYKLTCCKNYIHIECVNQYIDNKNNKTCPLCRKNIEMINYILLK